MTTAQTEAAVAPRPRPMLLLKTMVRGYVNAKGDFVQPHEDGRPMGQRRREGGEPGHQGLQHKQGEAKPASESMPSKAKHYAAPSYKVGQEVRVKGRDGLWQVTAVSGGVVSLRGPGGETATVKTGAAPMAKALLPGGGLVLLKANTSAPSRQGPQGAKGKPAGAKDKKPEADGKPSSSGVAQGKPEVPARGAPDGEHEMEHGDRVAFQHGKVKGEGEVVASGADGVMVKDDAGREHPVRHDNLLGVAGSETTPAPAGDGKPGEVDPAGKPPAGPAAGKPAKGGAAEDGEDMGAGDGDAGLEGMTPDGIKRALAILKVLAPFFGGKAESKTEKPAAKPPAKAKAS